MLRKVAEGLADAVDVPVDVSSSLVGVGVLDGVVLVSRVGRKGLRI